MTLQEDFLKEARPYAFSNCWSCEGIKLETDGTVCLTCNGEREIKLYDELEINKILSTLSKDYVKKDYIKKMLDVHREVVLITCHEDCFCWHIDKLLIRLELKSIEGMK